MATGIVNPLAFGMPSVGAVNTAAIGLIYSGSDQPAYKPGGGQIVGAKSRDPGNTPDVDILRTGTIMARHSTSGLYAVWAIGTFQAATLANATTLTLTVAQATELVRRIGASGSITVVGSATAGGSLVTEVVTYSGVNRSTGAVTVSAMTSAFVAGSVVTEANYTVPATFVDNANGLMVPTDGSNRLWPNIPVAANGVKTASLIPWPASVNTTLRNHIRTSLSTVSGGKFVFNDSI